MISANFPKGQLGRPGVRQPGRPARPFVLQKYVRVEIFEHLAKAEEASKNQSLRRRTSLVKARPRLYEGEKSELVRSVGNAKKHGEFWLLGHDSFRAALSLESRV